MFASANAAIDEKVMTLWKNYSDNHEVSTSLRDVESLRSSADNLGLAVTLASFGLNEVARLTLRSRKWHSSTQTSMSLTQLILLYLLS